jgi:chromosomal replication initiation ATPase DnaA
MKPPSPFEAWSRLPDPAKAIVREVSERREIHILEIMGTSRTAPITQARFEIWSRLYDRHYSMPRIGHLFGRDYTTVLSGLRRHAALQPGLEAAE